jgi:outer membrane lipoprotein LolB
VTLGLLSLFLAAPFRVRFPALITTLSTTLLATLFAGCVTAPPSRADLPWTQGRLLVKVDASPSRAASTASTAFELRGDSTRGDLRLLSPLGTSLASASWSPGHVQLATPGSQRQFVSLDALSQEVLGESLPLAALPDWLRGRPWPQAAHENTAEGFEQLGWQVQTTGRTQGWIEARRSSPPAVWLRVKLDSAP